MSAHIDGYDEVRRRIANDDGARYTLDEVIERLGLDPAQYDGDVASE